LRSSYLDCANAATKSGCGGQRGGGNATETATKTRSGRNAKTESWTATSMIETGIATRMIERSATRNETGRISWERQQLGWV
jgi:hypothetical protein